MDDLVPFGGTIYFVMLGVLVFARAMDLLSTWVATPHLVLEGNPIVKKLGWKRSLPLNVAMCVGIAMWPLPAVIMSTTSVLVAARNFQNAWLMRSMGEVYYRDWYVARLLETPLSLYLICLFGQTILTALVGVAIVWLGPMRLVTIGIGWGIVTYALAVTGFTLLSVWRIRR